MVTNITTHSAAETEAAGAALARALLAGGRRQAFIALNGEMGVGKTVFVRGFAAALGAAGVHSPTYTVVNEYRGGALPLFHFDLYRLSDEDELYAIGFDDYLAREGYALCEWSEVAPTCLPRDRITVDIARVAGDEDARTLRIGGLCLEDSGT